MPVFSCLGSGLPGPAHLVELRLKLRIDPKIVASGPGSYAVPTAILALSMVPQLVL
eukprot:SAG11_NODE_375_length_10004_cov_18.136699_1_plen_56_part_00